MVTILWSVGGIVAIALATLCGWLWLIERRDRASLMLCLLGIAAAGSGYVELGYMHSVSAAEFAAWQHWIQVPVYLGFMAVVLFVHYFLGTGRPWLLWTIILMRSAMFVANLFVYPSFNFASIDSVR